MDAGRFGPPFLSTGLVFHVLAVLACCFSPCVWPLLCGIVASSAWDVGDPCSDACFFLWPKSTSPMCPLPPIAARCCRGRAIQKMRMVLGFLLPCLRDASAGSEDICESPLRCSFLAQTSTTMSWTRAGCLFLLPGSSPPATASYSAAIVPCAAAALSHTSVCLFRYASRVCAWSSILAIDAIQVALVHIERICVSHQCIVGAMQADG
ncbi:hypothetical protein GQ54DRAFT_214097 [Martensiomyces pterosporus]|nr:hypothetical protein GQ54DRAFT_214097 [Martensiomyces pterosporus]